MEKPLETLGERIKKVRKDAALTQEEFARRIGIKRNSLSLIESGRNTSAPIIKIICQEFAVSFDWLVNGFEPVYLPKEEAANWKLERLMTGDNEFVKEVFRQLADLPAECWQELEALVHRLAEQKKNRP